MQTSLQQEWCKEEKTMVQLRWCDVFVSDFETTVDENTDEQSDTEVWAAGVANLRSNTFTPILTTSIDEWYSTLLNITDNKKNIVYFHNEKFDGSFILDYLLNKGYTVAFNESWVNDKDMPNYSVKTVISMENEWYELCIHIEDKKYIYIRDSIKLIPYSLGEIGHSIGYDKYIIDYTTHSKAGEPLTDEEKEYLTRDIEIMYYALRKFVIEEQHSGVTIGSCCKSEYMKTLGRGDLSYYFPNIASGGHDPYFRKAYFGGVCYVRPEIQGKVIKSQGMVYDVNSLYPSVMDSDRKYPISYPHYFKGWVPRHVFNREKVYFVHFKCRFNLKKGYIPFIRIEDDPKYAHRGFLTTSDIEVNGEYYSAIEENDGSITKIRAELTLNEVDWKLFCEAYEIEDLNMLGGAWFWAKTGKELFGTYINKYRTKKENSEGIERTESKLFLNNLAGKLSAKPESTTRVPYINKDGVLSFKNIIKEDLTRAWYIPAATFVTAYGREVLLKVIHQNYSRFMYCDTDSVHLTGSRIQHKGIIVDDKEFGCWKIERYIKTAIFAKQKTYIEEVYNTDDIPYHIVCAGMSARSKFLILTKLCHWENEIDIRSDAEREFLEKPFTLYDFKEGFEVPGGLVTKRIKGGTVLVPSVYRLT